MSSEKIILSLDTRRPIPASLGYRNKAISICAKLSSLAGQKPRFTVGAGIGNEAGGCLHEEVASVFPELSPVIALHLSDENGVPMYAVDNGYYWLAGFAGGLHEVYHGGSGKTDEECKRIFCDYMRVHGQIADALSIILRQCQNPKALFAAWVESQKPRWKMEADAAIHLLKTLGAVKH